MNIEEYLSTGLIAISSCHSTQVNVGSTSTLQYYQCAIHWEKQFGFHVKTGHSVLMGWVENGGGPQFHKPITPGVYFAHLCAKTLVYLSYNVLSTIMYIITFQADYVSS